jgi:protein-tyrosine phosphatase
MIDIHHHLLWGMDDGASSIETSIAMARMAAADGITHVVCSPHANSQYGYAPYAVTSKIYELQRILDAEGVALKLGQGCDFHLSYENIQEARMEPTKYTINGLGYLLVEIPDYGVPRGLTEIFYQLQLAGMTPILTHPERNPTLQADQHQQRLAEWLRAGVLVQVTAGSVLGHMGRRAERMAHQLLENRWVHFLATDAHNITSRPPKMREAMDAVAQKYGPDYAHLLCISNPLAAFNGSPLPQRIEPKRLYEDFNKKSWWQKLLSKS